MAISITLDMLDLDQPSILNTAVKVAPELFFALVTAKAFKDQGRFPVTSTEVLSSYIRNNGGTLVMPGVKITEADVVHVSKSLLPIVDAADFVMKLSQIIHAVHIERAARQQRMFEQTAKRDERGKHVLAHRIPRAERGH
jgi:hypothetical protein